MEIFSFEQWAEYVDIIGSAVIFGHLGTKQQEHSLASKQIQFTCYPQSDKVIHNPCKSLQTEDEVQTREQFISLSAS
jgi:hypothetical protein